MGVLDYYKEKVFFSYVYELKDAMAVYIRSSCKNNGIELGVWWDHEVLLLVEELLVIDCYWRKENQFSVRVCALRWEPWYKTGPTARSI